MQKKRIINYKCAVLPIAIMSILSLFSWNADAQVFKDIPSKPKNESTGNNKALKVGDLVPDYNLKMVNYIRKNAKISDFKDQLLILDFWDTSCGGCINAMPHMEALQKKFTGKITILPATTQEEKLIKDFWKTNRVTKDVRLPSVVEDNTGAVYFRRKGLPHEAWIYKGKVIAICSPEFVTENNIQKVLDGKNVNFPVKDDYFEPAFDITKRALFTADVTQVNPASILKYAAISGYDERFRSLNASIIRDSVNKTVRAIAINAPIYAVYLACFPQVLGWDYKGLVKPSALPIPQSANEIVWEVRDRGKYELGSNIEEWKRANAICFESLNPDTGQTDQQVYQTVIDDINRMLGLNVRWEKRKEKVLILYRTTTEDKLKSTKDLGTYDDKYHQFPVTYQQKGNLHQFRDYDFMNLTWFFNGNCMLWRC